MALSQSEKAVLLRLQSQIRRESTLFARLNSYYEGVQRLEHLGLAIPPELAHFVTIANWCRVAVDSLEERLDFEGFRLPGADERDEELNRIWQANNLDEESQLAHLDALVFSRSFVVIGSGDDPATPVVTVESPMEMAVEYDPRTRRVRYALKLYKDTIDGKVIERATLYSADSTVWLMRGRSLDESGWIEDPEYPRDDHNLGRVPVIPLVNRARTSDRQGVSELADVMGLADAAARALTLAQLATETLSVPQRYVLGASKGDFVDADGNVVPAWEAYFGAIWALQNKDAKVGQFSAADLSNFEKIVNHYAGLVSSVTGLPLRYFGQNTANPPSAEGIRADEARTIKRAERRQRSWGGAWEEVARFIKRFVDGVWDDELVTIESIWRDPSTPTRAQMVDAAVKLKQVNLLPDEALWEDMGISQTRIARLKEMRDEQARANDVLLSQVERYRASAVGTDPAATDPTAPTGDPAAA